MGAESEQESEDQQDAIGCLFAAGTPLWSQSTESRKNFNRYGGLESQIGEGYTQLTLLKGDQMGKGRGRVSREKLIEAKTKAIRFAKEQNLKPKEIAPLLGYQIRTVQNWLNEARKAGLLKSTRDLVIEMADHPADEIATKYNLSPSRVWAILQEHRGYPAKSRPTPEQRVTLFFEDPEASIGQPFTTTKPFGDALIRRCNRVVARNPHAGLIRIEPAIALFSRLANARPGKGGFSICHLLQAQGVKAFSFSKLSKHEVALQLIDSGHSLATDRCTSCIAEYHKRRGFTLTSWALSTKSSSRWLESLTETDKAIELTRVLDNDHDIHGNGLAHCYLNRAQIRYYTQGASAALVDVRTGLSLVDSGTSKDLQKSLLHALAAVLVESGDSRGVDQARQIMQNQLSYFGDTPTIPHMLSRWLMGLIERRAGDFETALFHLEDAIDTAVKLRLHGEVAAIAADLVSLNSDPRNVLAQIEGLGYIKGVESMPTQPPLPAYLNPSLRTDLVNLYDLAKTRGKKEIRVFSEYLRTRAEAFVSDGGKLLPAMF